MGFSQELSPTRQPQVLPPYSELSTHPNSQALIDGIFNATWTRGGRSPKDFLMLEQSYSHAGNFKAKEKITAVKWEYAKRHVNGLNDVFDNASDDFSLEYTYARENSQFVDHNEAHSRRVERNLESLLFEIPFLRHGEYALDDQLDALTLFSKFHDMSQLLGRMENEKPKNKNSKIRERIGHQLEAACTLFLMVDYYSARNKIPQEKAQHIVNQAAILILQHDDGIEALAAVDEKYKGKDVSYLVENLTYSEMFRLLKLLKTKGDYFPKRDENGWGMHPSLERTYSVELQLLSQDDQKLFSEYTQDFADKLTLAAEIANVADILEMVWPPIPALSRKLLTTYSQKRAFFSLPQKRIKTYQEYTKSFENANLEGNPTTEYEYLSSDVWRMLYELRKLSHLDNKNSDKVVNILYSQSEFLSLIKILSFMACSELSIIGREMMNGKFSLVRENYDKRKLHITEKALRKSLLSETDITQILSRGIHLPRNDTITLLESFPNLDPQIASQLSVKYDELDDEFRRIVKNFFGKPDSVNQKIRLYSAGEKKSYAALLSKTGEQIRKSNRSALRVLTKDYLSKILRLFGGYDSFAQPHERRTISVE